MSKICAPHPYADMICQWARTGQPVWVKVPSGTGSHLLKSCIEFYYYNSLYSYYKTTVPDWNIPGAEYSFTPFDKDAKIKLKSRHIGLDSYDPSSPNGYD